MSVSCAVLLDRDGTLIEDKHYLSEPSGVALLPGVGPALSRLVQAGHRLFLVSNQSGVGRGYFTEQAVVACQKRLEELLEPYGVALRMPSGARTRLKSLAFAASPCRACSVSSGPGTGSCPKRRS
ncbi:MAG: HAD-IIIA family hydrolase [Bilophila wadsworthia]